MENANIKIVEMLKKRGMTLAIAESLTGGLVSSAICGVPGASEVLLEGVVSYTDESKITRLGVRRETLEIHSSVSAQTAAEMAEGVRKNLGADIGISTTGVAGPGEADENANPRGLVYVGLSSGNETSVSRHMFDGTRNEIREQAKDICLERLYEILYEKERKNND